MSHYLDTLTIKNFKSCKHIEVKLSEFTPIIGYNNAGKSNILSAVEWLFKKKVLALDDYHDADMEICVEGKIVGVSDDILDGLAQEHRDKISPFIQDGIVEIKRTQIVNGSKAADVKLQIKNPANGQYRAPPTGIDNAIKGLFPEPIRVGAMENSAEDASKSKASSTIGKLLSELCESVQKSNSTRISKHLNAVSRRMEADGNKRIPELSDIDTSINEKIADFFPGINLKLHFPTPSFEDLFKSGTVKVYEDGMAGIARECSSYGHGTQRSIQMALIRHLADIKKNEQSSTTTLLLIDEPELYLHPFAIEQIREALNTLSGNGYQIIFTTHSSQMITEETAPHTILIRKNNIKGTYRRTTMAEAVARTIEDGPAQASHLFSLTQSSQVLFSNNVILTEGKTELRLLPFIFQKIQNRTLGQAQIAMIETGSVNNISKTLKILKAMDIPARAIVDLDYAFRGAIINGIINDDDQNIAELKKILQLMHDNQECKVGHNGLPTKGGVCTAAEAFEIMASKPEAHAHIQALAAILREHNIWLWQKGAIEAHLGLESKDEDTWSQFKVKASRSPLEEICPDHAGIHALIQWVSA
ncbi:ATP-dependent nuclease [Serratia bockelmannii]|uniref:ATP-dependent nuclease n=1 Tax=Serratia bockelmannii TaxID=2703793 RepID=UPI0033147184